MSRVLFTKMHGCGNDYIYVNASEYPLSNPGELSRRWSAPHTGVGADGLVLIGKSAVGDFSMRIFNADGSEARMCGNACRCMGKFVYEQGLSKKTMLRLETLSGLRELRLHVTETGSVDTVTVVMGDPAVEAELLPLSLEGVSDTVSSLGGTVVSVGNPHLVVFVPRVGDVDLGAVGPILERHPSLPGRTNVEFAEVIDRGRLRVRVWERGSGVTRACGSGASAAVAAAVTRGLTDRQTVVVMDGGELLINWEEETNSLMMTGAAVTVFEGCIDVPCESAASTLSALS
uniref:diaminopimelate epimerase n=1 Tax=Herpetomonas muscarum TaxID=5718 RepID=U5KM59_HERMU|nr:diaminopimelate epimerase [Herpetomonas muscarum]